MNSLVIVGSILWIYILSVLKRGKIHFWYFCFGSVGLFILMMILIQPIILPPLTRAVAAVAGIIGQLTGIYDSYFQYSMLFIQKGGESISLYIDFECSGVIETLAFSALLWFFPAYRFHEKIMVNLIGILAIFVSNILRIFSITLVIYIWGNKAYYLGHTLLGRMIFYMCSILLYYFVFTKTQIIRQKVGNFKYDDY